MNLHHPSLTFLTGNTNKFREAQAILGDNLQQQDTDLPEIQSLDPLAIIQHKINSVLQMLPSLEERGWGGGGFFVEDTSLVFHALGEFLGPLIKRVLRHEGAIGAYRLLADYDDRTATATCHIGYRDGEQTHFVSGSIAGAIVAPQGDTTFGRDPIFAPALPPLGGEVPKAEGSITFAQMSPSQKNSISHCPQALEKLLKIAQRNLKS